MKNISILFLMFAITFISCEKEQIIYVADHYDTNNKNLMLVKLNENEQWKAVDLQIEGFQYEEGYTYQLKVKGDKSAISKLASPISLQLVEVVSKSKSEVQASTTKGMEGEWYVIQIKDFVNDTGKNPSFKVFGNQISGNNGCNNFGGNIQFGDDQKVIFGGLFSTKMFCVETANLETAFMNALSKVEKYENTSDILNLIDTGGNVVMVCSLTKMEEKNDNSTQKDIKKEGKILIKSSNQARNYNREWTFDGEKIVLEQSRPTKENKTITLDKKEKEKINQILNKMDFNKLETLEAPSKDHQFDGAIASNLELISGGKTHVVPTFDKGKPPVYIKELIDYIEKLLSK